MKCIFRVVLALSALLILCLQAAPTSARDRGRPQIELKQTGGLGRFNGRGDRVSILQSTGLATINVRHVSGIASWRLSLITGVWPAKIKLVLLNFPYLENLTISGGINKVSLDDKKCLGKGKKSKRVFYVPVNILKSDCRDVDVSWVDAYR